MKKVILHMLVVLGVFSAVAQKPKPTQAKPGSSTQTSGEAPAKTDKATANPIAEHFAKKYGVAARWNDFEVAKDALYDLIVEYPGNDSLIFALAYFYYENQKYPSCVMICQDLLARNPRNGPALELSGIGYENLSIYDRALQSYESLFLLTTNNSTLYKMAALQYELKRFEESMTNIDILLTKPEVDSLKVVFNDSENKPKEYPMRAALLNLKGLVYNGRSDKINAKKSFEESLAMAPDFVLPKQNLASLK